MNENIRSVIIDDENDCRNMLKHSLMELKLGVDVVGEAPSANKGKALIDQVKPDLIFLDIEMSGESVFDMLKSYEKADFKIVFTTGHEKYALNAIKASAFDFLLKPIPDGELIACISKFRVNYPIKKNPSDWNNLLPFLQPSRVNSNEKIICVPSQKYVHRISTVDLVYCKADGNCSHLFFSSGTKITSCKTLKLYEQELPKHFIRVHNKHIVNLNFIEKYEKEGGGGILHLIGGEKVNVSRNKKTTVINALENTNHSDTWPTGSFIVILQYMMTILNLLTKKSK